MQSYTQLNSVCAHVTCVLCYFGCIRSTKDNGAGNTGTAHMVVGQSACRYSAALTNCALQRKGMGWVTTQGWCWWLESLGSCSTRKCTHTYTHNQVTTCAYACTMIESVHASRFMLCVPYFLGLNAGELGFCLITTNPVSSPPNPTLDCGDIDAVMGEGVVVLFDRTWLLSVDVMVSVRPALALVVMTTNTHTHITSITQQPQQSNETRQTFRQRLLQS